MYERFLSKELDKKTRVNGLTKTVSVEEGIVKVHKFSTVVEEAGFGSPLDVKQGLSQSGG